MGMRDGGTGLCEGVEKGLCLADVVNGELEGLCVLAHVCAEAARVGRAGVDETVHVAHLCKGLTESVEILLGDKLAVVDGAVEIDQDDTEVVCKDDSAAEKSGGGVAADAEGICGEDAVPGAGGDLEREEDALSGAETMDLLNAYEMVVAADEGEMTGGDSVGAAPSAELPDDVAEILLCVVAALLQHEFEAGEIDVGLLADVAEKGVAGNSFGYGAVIGEALAACEAYDVWV